MNKGKKIILVLVCVLVVLLISILGINYSQKNNMENNNGMAIIEDKNNSIDNSQENEYYADDNNEQESNDDNAKEQNENNVSNSAEQDKKDNTEKETSTANKTDKNTEKTDNSNSKNKSSSKNSTTNKNDKKDDTTVANLGKNDVFAKYYEKADEMLKNMTLEEKVGQMFLARFPESGVIEEIENYNPGGYVLFSRDFKNQTKSSMLSKLKKCQNASKIKLALGVDEEGDTVVRVSSNKNFRTSKFLSPQQLYKRGGLEEILKDSTEKTKLLKSIGLNMNLAPVADVPTKSSSFIYDRAYGRGAKETATYVSKLTQRMNSDGIISVMKHFPGYGDNVDTHTEIAIDNRSYSSFTKSDFLPFKSGIQAGSPCILVSHNIVKSMDSSKPASLSKKVHNILRNELNFSGIIMTDDLAMDAVKKYSENGEAAVQAVLAGNDMIISSSFKKQKQEVLNAVKQGKISEKQINTAVKRILSWKLKYKII